MLGKYLKGLASVAAALALCQASAQATVKIDITTSTSVDDTHSGAIGGGFVAAGNAQQPTGTGVFGSFVRIQQTGNEQGYNTSLGTPLDTKGGNFTHAITLGDVPTVTIGGVLYREFALDVNQIANGLISLNQIQIFTALADQLHTGLAAASATSEPIISFAAATEVFRLNNATNGPVGDPLQNSLEIVVDTGNGSGSGDMFFYVRDSVFAAATATTNVILYSQFGLPPGVNASNDGFEEWGIRERTNPVVPEPGAIAFMVTGLGTLGVTALRRRTRKATA